MEGLHLEFGVASGRTINHIASLLPHQPIFGFDWFRGLPENWRSGFPAGAFSHEVPTVAANVELIHGLFQDTLPVFLACHPEPVALLHVDCDLYSSTCTIFDALEHRIVPGTVIVFDEYFNYASWRQHEYKAFQEYLMRTGRRHKYLGLVPAHQQVCVQITA